MLAKLSGGCNLETGSSIIYFKDFNLSSEHLFQEHRKHFANILIFPRRFQGVNWTYIRRSEDGLDIF